MHTNVLAAISCVWTGSCAVGATLGDDVAAPQVAAETDPALSGSNSKQRLSTIDEVIDRLGSEQSAVRDAAEEELAGLGSLARFALERAAEHANAEIAVRAQRLLDKLPRLTHAIVDALGAPIAGATVTASVISDEKTDFALQESISVRSDDRGRISIPPLPNPQSKVFVAVRHPDYGAGSYEVDFHAKERVLRLPLVAAGTEARRRAVAGTVLAPSGRPVAGAVISCRSVRTPGEGLIDPVFPYGDAVTDEDGRFNYYLPNENRDRERGELIPANSHYHLTIAVPHDESMFPTAGRYSNLQTNSITLQHAARFYRFHFEAAKGGWIEDPEQLQRISVIFEGDSTDSDARVPLGHAAVTEGRLLIPGKYSAVGHLNGSEVAFEPIVVTRESPAHLEFQLPAAVVYRGRVVHGVTGEPVAGAFVIGWSSTSRQNLALLSADQWRLLRKLQSNPSLDHPAMKLLAEHYGVEGLVRTEKDGSFEITQAPDEAFYGLMAFAEHFVPFKVRNFSLKNDGASPIEAGEFALFPAAKVVVRPVHEGGHLSVSTKWLLADAGQPAWIDGVHAATDGQNRELEYVHWLRLNEPQPIFVPADVRLRLAFDSPYDDAWSPSVINAEIQLERGEVREVGDLRFAAALPAIVRVVDESGQPVEGVPVRRKYDDGDSWCVAHNTDASGQAYFHVNPASRGQFRVSDVPGPRELALAENLLTRFDVADTAPERPLEIVLTGEQKRLLLDSQNTAGHQTTK